MERVGTAHVPVDCETKVKQMQDQLGSVKHSLFRNSGHHIEVVQINNRDKRVTELEQVTQSQHSEKRDVPKIFCQTIPETPYNGSAVAF